MNYRILSNHMGSAFHSPWRSSSVLIAVLVCHAVVFFAAFNKGENQDAQTPTQLIKVSVQNSGNNSHIDDLQERAATVHGEDVQTALNPSSELHALTKVASSQSATSHALALPPLQEETPAARAQAISADAQGSRNAGAAAPLSNDVSGARFDAAYLQNPKPIYPSVSRRFGEEGKVILRVRVSANGQPLAIETKQSSGHTRLDDAARSAVEKWRFTPARRGTQPVEAWVLVPLTFNLDSE